MAKGFEATMKGEHVKMGVGIGQGEDVVKMWIGGLVFVLLYISDIERIDGLEGLHKAVDQGRIGDGPNAVNASGAGFDDWRARVVHNIGYEGVNRQVLLVEHHDRIHSEGLSVE